MKQVLFWVKKNREKVAGAILAAVLSLLFVGLFVWRDFVVVASIVINIVVFAYSALHN